METIKIPETTLSSGHKMPMIGLGTGAYPRLPPEQLVPLLVDAIAAGYRHFDSASMYGTEESIGRAVVEAVERGLIQSRDELFITTKLHMTDSHHHQVLPAIRQSLRNLGLEYVDLYLVHWPVSMKKDENGEAKLVSFEMKEIWEAMEECSRLGLAKSIGVSNFSTTKLSTLLQFATIKPVVNQLVPLLVDAIAAGYRHIDTAAMYGTEESVGRAVAEAVQRGLIKSRDEVFITTKLNSTDSHHHQVVPAIQQSLRKLGLEYVDLYLIHWPLSMKKDENGEVKLVNFEMKEIWEAMEECSRMGLAKSIGVSNFSTTKLSTLLQFATIKPAVNQVEMNVGWQQQKMVQYCKEKGIHVSAWSPLGARGSPWGSNAVMESPILNDIAAATNKTIAQVALRWIYEQGASFIVRSFNRERMKQNLQVLDWELRDEDGEKIKLIPQNRVGNGANFVSPDGQYKSLEELWDGEI